MPTCGSSRRWPNSTRRRRASSSPSRSRRAISTVSARSTSVSTVRDVDPEALRARLRMRSGGIYNAEAVEKTVEEMTIEMSKRGYAFAQVRPRGDRDFQTRIINVVFVVEEGARVYIERHQYPRQYAHPRLRDPARVRYRRGRCLQPRADRSRRAAAEEPELLQDGEDHQRAGLGARPRRHQRRRRGAVDRRVLDRRAAIRPRTASSARSASASATCSAAGSSPRPPSSTASIRAASNCPSSSRTFSTTGCCWASTSSPSRRCRTTTSPTTRGRSVAACGSAFPCVKT